MTLAERVRLFDNSNYETIFKDDLPSYPPSQLPRQKSTRVHNRRRRHLLNNSDSSFSAISRFQTQPITVDEVQEASKNLQFLRRSPSSSSNENLTLISLRNSKSGVEIMRQTFFVNQSVAGCGVHELVYKRYSPLCPYITIFWFKAGLGMSA